jgi:Spy/CpxP family protein refolding chaperone
MVFLKSAGFAWRPLALILLSCLVVGCGENGAIADPEGGSNLGDDPGELVEDPFEGALNSTLGYTPPDPDNLINRLAEALGLDADQKEDLASAYLEFREAHKDLRDQVRSGELTREEACELAAELRESFEAELQIILTPEQYELLQELRDGRNGRGGEPGDGPWGRPGDGERGPFALWTAWLTEVGADSSQIETILGALTTLHEGMQEIRDQVRDGTLTREEAKAAAEELRAAFDAVLQDVLTAEQYEALQELRPDCRGKPHGGGREPA